MSQIERDKTSCIRRCLPRRPRTPVFACLLQLLIIRGRLLWFWPRFASIARIRSVLRTLYVAFLSLPFNRRGSFLCLLYLDYWGGPCWFYYSSSCHHCSHRYCQHVSLRSACCYCRRHFFRWCQDPCDPSYH